MKKYLYPLVLFFIVILTGCQKEKEEDFIKVTSGLSYTVEAAGGTVNVNVETNTDYFVSIPDDAKNWISVIGSRATMQDVFSLSVTANNTTSRTAKISLKNKSGEVLANIQISQEVQTIKITDGATYEVDPKGETIDVNLETNTEYKVSIPDNAKNWISVVESRSTRKETITLNISANTDKQRIAKLLFIEKSGETLASIQISQDASSFITDMTKAFPDENFRKYILDNFDLNKDGVLSEEEALYVKEINVTTFQETSEKIKTIEGVQYFKNLNMLACENNLLTNLDISKNTSLQVLSCQYNYINKLDISKNTLLTALYCYDNNITDLDVSNNIALGILACDDNPLKNLDISNNTALNYLNCCNNQLTSLDVSNNISLQYLRCDNNHIKSLDLSNCTSLIVLNCSNNQIISLDVSKTNLVNNNSVYATLTCNMSTLNTLYLKNGWRLEGINTNRSTEFINQSTEIKYRD